MRYSKIYNSLNEKLSELTDRVPVDTVSNDWFSLSVNNLKNSYNSNVAIIRGLESMYVDDNNNFNIEELKKHKDDWNLYESIMNYTLPAIVAALHSNENINITDIDTTVTAVDQANKLYLDAVDELYIESHPQYIYTDNVENIYALPEFKKYHEKLGINSMTYVRQIVYACLLIKSLYLFHLKNLL